VAFYLIFYEEFNFDKLLGWFWLNVPREQNRKDKNRTNQMICISKMKQHEVIKVIYSFQEQFKRKEISCDNFFMFDIFDCPSGKKSFTILIKI
jgi:hypothetical protein